MQNKQNYHFMVGAKVAQVWFFILNIAVKSL